METTDLIYNKLSSNPRQHYKGISCQKLTRKFDSTNQFLLLRHTSMTFYNCNKAIYRSYWNITIHHSIVVVHGQNEEL